MRCAGTKSVSIWFNISNLLYCYIFCACVDTYIARQSVSAAHSARSHCVCMRVGSVGRSVGVCVRIEPAHSIQLIHSGCSILFTVIRNDERRGRRRKKNPMNKCVECRIVYHDCRFLRFFRLWLLIVEPFGHWCVRAILCARHIGVWVCEYRHIRLFARSLARLCEYVCTSLLLVVRSSLLLIDSNISLYAMCWQHTTIKLPP